MSVRLRMNKHPVRWLLGRGRADTDMPPWIFFVALVWLVALFVLFVVWITSPGLRGDFPHAFGQIPVEVPWFGALGGCLVSLSGIVYYNRGRWRPRYNYWHPIKPLIGVGTGSIGALLLLVTLRAASSNASIKTDAATFDAAAFVFGYGEAAFRQLIKTVTDLLLRPGGSVSGDGTTTRRSPGASGRAEHPKAPAQD